GGRVVADARPATRGAETRREESAGDPARARVHLGPGDRAALERDHGRLRPLARVRADDGRERPTHAADSVAESGWARRGRRWIAAPCNSSARMARAA